MYRRSCSKTVSDTGEKNNCRLAGSEIYISRRTQRARERERTSKGGGSDKVSPVSRYVSFDVRRHPFRHASCPRLERGPRVLFALGMLRFSSLRVPFPHRGSLPRPVYSPTRRAQLPDTRGRISGASPVAFHFTVVRRQPSSIIGQMIYKRGRNEENDPTRSKNKHFPVSAESLDGRRRKME